MSDQITQVVTQLSALANLPSISQVAQTAINTIADLSQQVHDLAGQAASLQSQLDLANAHARDLQQQLDAARKGQTPTPPPVVKGLIVTALPGRKVSINAQQQAGVVYNLSTQEAPNADIVPGPQGITLPATIDSPAAGNVYGLIVTPVLNGVAGEGVHADVDFTKVQPASPAQPAPPAPPPTKPTPPNWDAIKVMLGAAGCATFFDGSGVVPADEAINYSWSWKLNEGDPVAGFNAACVYEQAGEYTITLSLRDATGTIRAFKTTVAIPASARRMVNVPNGADLKQFNGQADLELVLAKGGTYATGGLTIGERSVVRANGSTINLSGEISLSSGSRLDGARLTYPGGKLPADLSKYTREMIDAGTGMAIYPQGRGIAITGCDFDDVAYAVNGNRKPVGVLIDGCSAVGDIRGYLAWVQGEQWVIVNNIVTPGPIIEHVIRAEGDPDGTPVRLIAVCNNTLANMTGRWPGDNPKGSAVLHNVEHGYVAGNRVFGTGDDAGGIGTGPLEESFIKGDPERTKWVVIEDNVLKGNPIRVDPGALWTAIRRNTVSGVSVAIVVRAVDGARGRDVENLTISENNLDGVPTGLSITQGTVKGLQSDWGVG